MVFVHSRQPFFFRHTQNQRASIGHLTLCSGALSTLRALYVWREKINKDFILILNSWAQLPVDRGIYTHCIDRENRRISLQ
jgi:hypothetical protein